MAIFTSQAHKEERYGKDSAAIRFRSPAPALAVKLPGPSAGVRWDNHRALAAFFFQCTR
jgi:hypothetical protein